MATPRKATPDPRLTAAIRPVAAEIAAAIEQQTDELTDELDGVFDVERRVLRAAIYYELAADLLLAAIATTGRRIIDDASQRGDHQRVGELAGVGRNGIRYAFDRRRVEAGEGAAG